MTRKIGSSTQSRMDGSSTIVSSARTPDTQQASVTASRPASDARRGSDMPKEKRSRSDRERRELARAAGAVRGRRPMRVPAPVRRRAVVVVESPAAGVAAGEGAAFRPRRDRRPSEHQQRAAAGAHTSPTHQRRTGSGRPEGHQRTRGTPASRSTPIVGRLVRRVGFDSSFFGEISAFARRGSVRPPTLSEWTSDTTRRHLGGGREETALVAGRC